MSPYLSRYNLEGWFFSTVYPPTHLTEKFLVSDWGYSRLWHRVVDFIPQSGTNMATVFILSLSSAAVQTSSLSRNESLLDIYTKFFFFVLYPFLFTLHFLLVGESLKCLECNLLDKGSYQVKKIAFIQVKLFFVQGYNVVEFACQMFFTSLTLGKKNNYKLYQWQSCWLLCPLCRISFPWSN